MDGMFLSMMIVIERSACTIPSPFLVYYQRGLLGKANVGMISQAPTAGLIDAIPKDWKERMPA